MSGPRRRDRAPKGSIKPKVVSKKTVKKEIELYTPVVRLEKPTNDVQDARMLSWKLFKQAYPERIKDQGFPCGNALCDHCDEQHKYRLKELESSDL